VTGTKGKSYSRQSTSGVDRNGEPLKDRIASSKRLRKEIAEIAMAMPGDVMLATNKKTRDVIEAEKLVPERVKMAHFGRTRALNTWEECSSGIAVGRESVSVETVENLARAFMTPDPVPFISMVGPLPADWAYPFWPYRASRGRRMRDGSIQIVEVEVHPDPRVQEVLEQIREADIVQTIDRPRPIFNHRTLTLANDLVCDITYDRVLTHAELVAGGTRWERAWATNGVIPLSKADLCLAHPGLFPTASAAEIALRREMNQERQSSNRNPIWGMSLLISYRRTGQSGKGSRLLVDAKRYPDARAAVEAILGPLAVFEAVQPAVQPEAAPPPAPAPTPPTEPIRAPKVFTIPCQAASQPEPELRVTPPPPVARLRPAAAYQAGAP
jgi:hypothetical protein